MAASVFDRRQYYPSGQLAQIQRKREFCIGGGAIHRNPALRVPHPEEAGKPAAFRFEGVDGHRGVTAPSRMHRVILAATEAALHPTVHKVESQWRVNSDRRM